MARSSCGIGFMRGCAVFAAAMLTAWAPARVFAQASGSISYGHTGSNTFNPKVTRGEIDVLSRILKLTPEDRASLVGLFEAHDAEVRAEGNVVRHKIRELSEEAELMQRQSYQERIRPEVDKWEKRKEELEKSFLADLTAMLTKEQEAMWPIVERELRRPRLLAESWMSGEGVDVVAMIASVDPAAAESPKVLELLDRYANEIDVALKARDAFVEAHKEEMAELLKNDPQKALSYRKDSVRNRVRIREINERYVQQVSVELSDASRKKFLDQFLASCIVWWNRETPAERYIEAAAKVDGLDAVKRAEMTTIVKEYEARVNELTKKTVKEYQAWEESRVPSRLAVALGTMTEEEAEGNELSDSADDSPLGKVRLERLKLDREYRSKVRALLTPEQEASVNADFDDNTKFFSLDDSPRL
ncbi:MAG: hypothetical protein ACKVZJ_02935 [Phycisphaerales bacterium]